MGEYKPVALLILDGWGILEMVHGNAVAQAKTPNFDTWLCNGERSILDASGEAVGLPRGQMGNSEVGHLNLGAGRIIYQDILRIDRAIQDGSIAENETLQHCFQTIRKGRTKLHLMGLIGTGGVHSHNRHLYALLRLAKQHHLHPILHVITDGRDTPPKSAANFIPELETFLQSEEVGTITMLSGRYYAMDRDKRWERTKAAYDAMVHRKGRHAQSASNALKEAYAAGESDEFIQPFIISGQTARNLSVEPGDHVLCFNFRADRMRQIVGMLTGRNSDEQTIDDLVRPLHLVTMTTYESDLSAKVIFEQQNITNPLAQVISDHNLKQFHAAETEKYAHVTYFFNGGNEEPFPGEERLLVQSPKVATYNLQPEMSAPKLAREVENRISTGVDDFILVNFANPDMVGHTGDLAAAIKAVETTDECAGRLVRAVTDRGGVAIVTADHGNAERMIDEVTGTPHTYHTTEPVSLFAVGNDYIGLRPRGILADVAPTVLELMEVPQPDEMTGKSLLTTDL